MKKTVLFAAICIAAILVLYVMWPTKIIDYLTQPVASDREINRTLSRFRAGGSSWKRVIRKKLPDIPQVATATADRDNPLVVAKKIPVVKAAEGRIDRVRPETELPPLPAALTEAVKPQPADRQPAAAAPLSDLAERSGDAPATVEPPPRPADLPEAAAEPVRTTPAALTEAVQPQPAGKQPAAAAPQVELAERSGDAAATVEPSPRPAVAEAGAPPALKEQPAVHQIEENIVARPYSLMLASCRRLDNARKVVDQYRRKGLSPYVVRVDLGKKGIWWRVFEGRYSSAEEASGIRTRSGLSQALVKKTPYAVMIGAYASEKDAAAEVRRLEKLKHSPYFVQAPHNQVRLLVGAFASEQGAQQLMDELTARGISNRIVDR